jgi:hypothetical protein
MSAGDPLAARRDLRTGGPPGPRAHPSVATPIRRVAPSEWRWVLAATLVLLGLVELPALVAVRQAAPDAVFSGFLFNVQDGNSYLAKMQAGAHGAWLLQIPHTTEPHQPVPLFVFHLLLGRAAGALGLGLPLAYHLAGWLAGALMLAVTYRFVALFLGTVALRRLAWLLVAAGGGLSWLGLAAAGVNWVQGEPLDLYSPEAFASLALIYTLPHLALARAGLLGGLTLLIGAVERGRVREALLAAGVWLATALIVPLYVVVMAAVTIAYAAALGLRARPLPRRAVALALVAVAWTPPVSAYIAWIFRADAVLASWSAQSNIYSPAPIYYAAAYGLPALLALAGLPWALRARRRWWLLAWLAVIPLLVTLPVNFQRRLLEGVQVALAILAVAGLAVLGARLARRAARRRQLLRAAVLGALLPTNLLLLATAFATAVGGAEPAFHPRGLVSTAGWLERNAPGGHVLSSFATGNALPALAYVRTYIGHEAETPDIAARQAAVRRFYQATTPDAERRALLAAGTIDYVVFGPAERALGEPEAGATRGAFDPAGAAYLEPVYTEGEWRLYRVISP